MLGDRSGVWTPVRVNVFTLTGYDLILDPTDNNAAGRALCSLDGLGRALLGFD